MFNELLKNVMNLGIITEDDVKRLTAIELMMLIIERINGLLNHVEMIDEKLVNLLEDIRTATIEQLNQWKQDGTIGTLLNHTAIKQVNDRIDETNAHLSDVINQVNERMDETDAQLLDVKKKRSYSSIQTNLLSLAIQKLSKKEKITIVCQGDSLTYGQDTLSSDMRSKDMTPCDDGSLHEFTRAGVTYPEYLQTLLNEVYPNVGHQVINKGYSGDWVERGLSRWNNNSKANLAFIMYGTNDSHLGATWVPSNVQGNIEKFLIDYRKLIERYLEWGTACVIILPPRQQNRETLTSGRLLQSYRTALLQLGKEYSIPVVDGQAFTNGWNGSFWVDGTHFNTKGYKGFASKLMSQLIGFGLVQGGKTLISGDTISVRTSRDNMVFNNVTFEESNNSNAVEESSEGKGLNVLLGGGKIHYSFNTLEDNLILIPIYSTWGKSGSKFTLDFGTQQGSIVLKNSIDTSIKYLKPSSILIPSLSETSGLGHKVISKVYQTGDYLHITNKGNHVVTVEQVDKTAVGFAFNGFIVLSYQEFKNNYGNLSVGYYYGQTDADNATTTIPVVDLFHKIGCSDVFGEWEYWKHPMLNITVTNYGLSSVTYSYFLGSLHDGAHSSFLGETSRINMIDSPKNEKTIDSINYDSDTRSLTITWKGNVARQANFVVKIC